jgi:hypothetical protein
MVAKVHARTGGGERMANPAEPGATLPGTPPPNVQLSRSAGRAVTIMQDAEVPRSVITALQNALTPVLMNLDSNGFYDLPVEYQTMIVRVLEGHAAEYMNWTPVGGVTVDLG